MARPVEFDEAKVLTCAMEQFGKKDTRQFGSETSDCTGINRGTLQFVGDKDTFSKSCVDQYSNIIEQHLDASLKNEKLGPWESIIAYFTESVAGVSNRHRAMGCLLVNSLCESINYDRDMKRTVRGVLAGIRKAMLVRLNEAQKKGKLKKGVSAETAADVLRI